MVTFIKQVRRIARAQNGTLARGPMRRARRLAIASGLLALFCTLQPDVYAQDNVGADWESGPAESRCSPRCRSGYECKHSECVPMCSPSCGPGYLCTAGGSCVRTDGAPPPASSNSSQGWGSSSNQCLPSCRTGFTCVSSQCVSLCNPICPVGEMCTEHGECVVGSPEPDAHDEPMSKEPPKKAEPAKPARSSSADSIVNLHFDALGLLQFGLTPTVEAGKKFSGYLRLRPLNAGLMSYFLLAPESGDRFKWGIGAALGMHIFSAGEGNMRGVFGGPALEYVFVETENTSIHKATYGTHVLIPQADLGYRWGFDKFLLGVGGRLGVSLPVAHYDEQTGVNGCALRDSCDGKRKIYVFGGIFVDIGVFL